MIDVADKIYTIEEYFQIEANSEIRHEFVYGKLIPMSGESKIANDIALNCATWLRQILTAKGFKVYVQSVKVQVDEKGLYRYPDVVIAPKSDDANSHLVTQPIVLIEVVSESSADRDRVTKLREYVRIPSLQHYIIIDQFELLVESYRREGDSWTFEILETIDAEIDIKVFDLKLSLTVIYKGVEFGDNQ